MASEILKNFIGKKCMITTGAFEGGITGKILSIEDHWIEIETKKGTQLVNSEYVVRIIEAR